MGRYLDLLSSPLLVRSLAGPPLERVTKACGIAASHRHRDFIGTQICGFQVVRRQRPDAFRIGNDGDPIESKAEALPILCDACWVGNAAGLDDDMVELVGTAATALAGRCRAAQIHPEVASRY